MKSGESMREKIIAIITSIIFAIFLISTTVKITLNFRPLYYFDIEYLKITEEVDMDKEEIKRNYDVLIDYLQPSYKGELEFPSLPMSEEGRIHFVDVKNIFIFFEYVMWITLFISFGGLIYLIIKNDYIVFKYTAIMLFAFPLILIIPFLINFNYVFTLFHKIAFTNDYWLFDPSTDPIILLLPERYFMHCALLMVVLVTIYSIILMLLYRYLIFRYVKRKGAE